MTSQHESQLIQCSQETESQEFTTPSSKTSTTSPQTGWQRGFMYGALATEFMAGVVGGGVAGYYLDRWQGTSPLWTLLLLVSGCAGGLYLLLRGISQLEHQAD